MAQAELVGPVSLSPSAEDRAETKEQSALRSALSSARVPDVYHVFLSPFAKGTSLLCRFGDISILH